MTWVCNALYVFQKDCIVENLWEWRSVKVVETIKPLLVVSQVTEKAIMSLEDPTVVGSEPKWAPKQVH